MILQYAIIVFITQLVFIFTRTWNVKAISEKNIRSVLISGGFVHVSWLISIAIGTDSMNQILAELKWEHLPVIGCSLAGGLLGSYLSMKSRRKSN